MALADVSAWWHDEEAAMASNRFAAIDEGGQHSLSQNKNGLEAPSTSSRERETERSWRLRGSLATSLASRNNPSRKSSLLVLSESTETISERFVVRVYRTMALGGLIG